MTYVAGQAARLALSVLQGKEPRRTHVFGVGEFAETSYLAHPDLIGVNVVAAAWLHDIGYADAVEETGFHPIDGALFLREQGWRSEVCNLVAFHTGAEIEAEERGLSAAMWSFERPAECDLDMLTMLDLSIGPSGQPMSPKQRVAEILQRYGEHEPVHRAIRRAGEDLIDSANRAAERLARGASGWPQSP